MPTPSDEKFDIQRAAACVFIYQFLARTYQYPNPEVWQWLSHEERRSTFLSAVRSVDGGPLLERARELAVCLAPDKYESFYSDYLEAFGHAARGRCPINEIEYGDLKADPLFQPHRLADLAAFYRAFGLQVDEEASERHDHIGFELEFMSVLWVKELYALENEPEGQLLAVCREARRTFLREHLGRWVPAFARRLSRFAEGESLRALAGFTREWVEMECRRAGVAAGSEDVLLRSVDEAAESLCASCGITSLPPGA